MICMKQRKLKVKLDLRLQWEILVYGITVMYTYLLKEVYKSQT